MELLRFPLNVENATFYNIREIECGLSRSMRRIKVHWDCVSVEAVGTIALTVSEKRS